MRFGKSSLLATSALIAVAAASPAYSQTPGGLAGFYFGGNVGYSWGKAQADVVTAPFTMNNPFILVYQGGSDSFTLHPNGFLGGVQIGYNWYVSPAWLIGAETDFQWTGQKDSVQGILSGTVANCTFGVCNFNNLTDLTAKLSWFGTLRGRFGPEVNGLWFYATGGLAYGHVSVSGVNTFQLTSGGAFSTTTPFSFSNTKSGWTIGGGVESRFGSSNWTWKVEYLHIDLGSIGGGSFGSLPNVNVNVVKFTDEIFRVGLNFSPRP